MRFGTCLTLMSFVVAFRRAVGVTPGAYFGG